MANDVQYKVELLGKSAGLERICREKLSSGDITAFLNSYNELWDLFEMHEDMKDIRIGIAATIADLSYALGEYYHVRRDIFKLTGAYNAAYDLARAIPESIDAARACVMLAVGVFEMKFAFHELENIESYIDELIPVTARFAEDEAFAEQSAAALCNLLQLCPYDPDVFVVRMRELLGRIGEIADCFPANGILQLCYLRSLTFFLCYGKPRLIDEVYERYYALTKEAFAERKGPIDSRDYDDMIFELARCDITFSYC